MWVAQGNHEIHSADIRPWTGRMPMTILHFPVRSYAQLERKVVLGGRAYARNPSLAPWIGAGGLVRRTGPRSAPDSES